MERKIKSLDNYINSEKVIAESSINESTSYNRVVECARFFDNLISIIDVPSDFTIIQFTERETYGQVLRNWDIDKEDPRFNETVKAGIYLLLRGSYRKILDLFTPTESFTISARSKTESIFYYSFGEF